MNYAITGLILVICITHAKISYIRIRNSFLRVYLGNCEKTKIRNVSRIYHSFINKCYDMQLFYYKLTDEEKDIIETIWSFCY
jgi:hypothetical protein